MTTVEKLLIGAGLVLGVAYLGKQRSAPEPAGRSPAVAVPILAAGPEVPACDFSPTDLTSFLAQDVIAPDERDALVNRCEGVAADANAIANGIAKINSWLAIGGTA